MLGDLRSLLCWAALVLFLALLFQHGCGARMDRFHEWRQERQEQRQERWERRRSDGQDQGQDGSGRRHWRWGRSREQQDSNMPEAEDHATQVFQLRIFTA